MEHKLIESLLSENRKLSKEEKRLTKTESKRVVKEDFSPNFPDWVKDALRPTQSGWNPKYKVSTGSFDRLNAKNIDFSRANFVEADPPTSSRDPILKDPTKIPIFMLDDGPDYKGNPRIVYFVPGASSSLHNSGSPELHRPGAPSWDTISADKAPWKLILDKTVKFGYIDLSDASNKATQLRRDRALAKKDLVTRGKGQYKGSDGQWYMTKGQDKSGYPLDPNKYVRKLNSVGFDNYSQRLERMYSQIEAFRSELVRVMSNVDLINPKYKSVSHFGYGTSSDLEDALNSFSRAIGEYKELLKTVDRIVSKSGWYSGRSDEDLEDSLTDVFKRNSVTFKQYLDDAKATIKHIDENPQYPDEE